LRGGGGSGFDSRRPHTTQGLVGSRSVEDFGKQRLAQSRKKRTIGTALAVPVAVAVPVPVPAPVLRRTKRPPIRLTSTRRVICIWRQTFNDFRRLLTTSHPPLFTFHYVTTFYTSTLFHPDDYPSSTIHPQVTWVLLALALVRVVQVLALMVWVGRDRVQRRRYCLRRLMVSELVIRRFDTSPCTHTHSPSTTSQRLPPPTYHHSPPPSTARYHSPPSSPPLRRELDCLHYGGCGRIGSR